MIPAAHRWSDAAVAAVEQVRDVAAHLFQMQQRRHDLEIHNKAQDGGQDWVTEADLAADRMLAEALPAVIDVPYVSEESGDSMLIADPEASYWLVDPIDGTNNFINGLPMYGVSVALMQQGRPEIGILVFPALDESFLALRGAGAWCNGERIHTRSHDPATWMVEVSSQPQDQELLRNAMALIASVRSVRILGSIALSLAWTASGRMDLFMGRGYPWDVAAGMLLLEEAGGIGRRLNGESRDLLRKELMLAGPPPHVAEAIQRINPSGA